MLPSLLSIPAPQLIGNLINHQVFLPLILWAHASITPPLDHCASSSPNYSLVSPALILPSPTHLSHFQQSDLYKSQIWPDCPFQTIPLGFSHCLQELMKLLGTQSPSWSSINCGSIIYCPWPHALYSSNTKLLIVTHTTHTHRDTPTHAIPSRIHTHLHASFVLFPLPAIFSQSPLPPYPPLISTPPPSSHIVWQNSADTLRPQCSFFLESFPGVISWIRHQRS